MKKKITLHKSGKRYCNTENRPYLCGNKLHDHFDIAKGVKNIDIVLSTTLSSKAYPVTIEDHFYIMSTDSKGAICRHYMYSTAWYKLQEFSRKHGIDTIYVSLEH